MSDRSYCGEFEFAGFVSDSFVLVSLRRLGVLDSDQPPPSSTEMATGNGQSCNGVTIAFVIAVSVLAWVGYRFGTPYGLGYSVLGVIGGVAVGVLVTPFLFVALIVIMHVVIKIEDWFQPPKS